MIEAYKALADEGRIRLLNVLLDRELSVSELVKVLDMSQPSVSRHLKILASAGFLNPRRDGRFTFYCADTGGEQAILIESFSRMAAADGGLARDQDRADQAIAERKALTQRFFDEVGEKWSDLRNEILGGVDLGQEVLSRMTRPKLAVDLGCGTGDLLAAMREKASRVVGVDNSTRMLEAASRRFENDPSVRLRHGELEHLPLGDSEADFAVLSLVLHHLPDPQAALNEASRILALNGRLVVIDFDRHENEALRERYGDHRLGFSAEEMDDLLDKAGFVPSVTKEYPVNQGLTVVVRSCTKG